MKLNLSINWLPVLVPVLLSTLSFHGLAQAVELNDTGLGGPDHYGQEYGRDAWAAAGLLQKVGGGVAGFDFTRICWNGQEEGQPGCSGTLIPNYSNDPIAGSQTDWACTRDNVTGLVWSVQSRASDFGGDDNVKSWAEERVSGPASGHNGSSRCGINSGWRMPDYDELLSIVNFGVEANNPRIDRSYFPGRLSWHSNSGRFEFADTQWTSTSDGSSSESGGKFIPFSGDMPSSDLKIQVNANYTVYRPVWSANDEGMAHGLEVLASLGSAQMWNLEQGRNNAVDVANFLKLQGHDDWRAANIKEIAAIKTKPSLWQVAITWVPDLEAEYVYGGNVFLRKYLGTISSTNAISTLPVRGGSNYSGYINTEKPPVTLTIETHPGGLTQCSESGQLPYGAAVQCTPQPDEGFAYPTKPFTSWSDTLPTDCSPFNVVYLNESYAGHVLLSRNGNLVLPSLIKSCRVGYRFTQVRSLVQTAVTPVKGGKVSCTGTGSEGWVGIGGTGSCEAEPNPGYRLRSISGCDGVPTNGNSYTTGEVVKSCTVTAAYAMAQAIDFVPPGIPPFTPGGVVELTATASSGLPVSFMAEPSEVCTVEGNALTMVSPGACTVTAAQAGSDDVDPAQPVALTLRFSSSELHLVPTLTGWGLALIGLLAAILGIRQVRRIQEA